MTAVAARARGLVTTVLSADALAAIARARSIAAIAAELGVAGCDAATPDALDAVVRERLGRDLASLARWSDALAIVALDEDRRSVRAIVRGLAAGVAAGRRLAGTVATPSLPHATLEALAHAASLGELARLLARRAHPYAAVIAAARTPIDPLALELALAHRFAEHARTRDRALRTYVAQVLDAENAAAALLLAERGHARDDLDPDAAFVAGGRLVDRATFVAAASAAPDAARDRIAAALARTPLAGAVYSPEAAVFEDAVLAWQLAAQARLRLLEPLGLAPALYLVLRRRDEARRIRRAAWRIALAAGAGRGGAA